MNYAVVMAGGTGKRLWPLSRQKRPKQVLKIIDGQTLLRRCFDRLTPIFDSRNIIILTNAGYADVVRENLSELPFNNVIAEPVVRDTSGAIGLAAAILTKVNPESTMAVLTADQVIEPTEVFCKAVTDALAFVNENPDALVTFGIEPTFASTQFGYIKCGNKESSDTDADIYKVDSFKEKPIEATAKKYVKSGDYLWNSGMFVWKAKTILEKLEQYLPECSEPLETIKRGWDGHDQQTILEENFPKLPKISIDFAVMEKTQKVFTIRLKCRWLDLGAFSALSEFITSDDKKNIVVAGDTELLDCTNSVIVTEDKKHLIAGIGLKDMVVAHTPDATLICPKDQTDKIKELLEHIAKHTGNKYL
jgi:mannose-1-phosphate guanylyltransferase